MKALTPWLLRSGAIVDGEGVNTNLRRAASDINRNMSKRYTRMPPIIIPMDGVTDALTAQLRSIKFEIPALGVIEIVSVEFHVYATAGVTWTLSASGSGVSWTSISLATAGATTEATASSDQPLQVPASGGVTFTVAGSAAGTITRGWLALHCIADRGVQGSSPSFAGYSPSYINSASSTAGSVLDTELTNLASAVTRDSDSSMDVRCACFVARNFSTTQTWNLPSGAGFTGMASNAYIVATAADAFTVSGTPSAATMVMTGTGTSNIVSDNDVPSNTNDDPTDTTDDVTVSFGAVAGTVELGYLFCWWS